jgi:hypothetical protein
MPYTPDGNVPNDIAWLSVRSAQQPPWGTPIWGSKNVTLAEQCSLAVPDSRVLRAINLASMSPVLI